MESRTENFSIKSQDQEHDPATSRFLDSLGFGESLLQDLAESGDRESIPAQDKAEEEKAPSVMLSSQMDDIASPEAKVFSESITPTRRGGLQDITRKSSCKMDAAEPDEQITVQDLDEVLPDEEPALEPANEKAPETTLEERVAISEETDSSDEEDEIAALKSMPADLDDVEGLREEDSDPENEKIDGEDEQFDFFAQMETAVQEEEKPDKKRPTSVSIDILSIDRKKQKVEPEALCDLKVEADPEAAEKVNDLAPEPIVLSCPSCDEELTLQKEHLGVEGACVWCEISLVAAESGNDGTVRVFVIQSEKSSEEPEEMVVVSEGPEINSAESEKDSLEVESCKEQACELDLQEPMQAEAKEIPSQEEVPDIESPKTPVAEESNSGQFSPFVELKEDMADKPEEESTEIEKECESSGEAKATPNEDSIDFPGCSPSFAPLDPIVESDPLVDSKTDSEEPTISDPAPVSAGGFADLPSEIEATTSEIEVETEVLADETLEDQDTAEVPLDSAWAGISNAKTESTEPNVQADLEPDNDDVIITGQEEAASASAFAELGQEALIADLNSPSTETKNLNSEQQALPAEEKEQAPEMPEVSSASTWSDVAVIEEEQTESSSSNDPVLEDEEKAPSPTAEPAWNKPKQKDTLPNDVVDFLATLEAETAEPPSDTPEQEESVESELLEIPSAPEEIIQEEAPIEEPPLTKRELKKQKRAAKKEKVSDKTMPGTKGPLPSPAPAPKQVPAKKGFKLPAKTKVSLILIAGLVVGFGIASFFIPVQEYVEKARTVVSDAFAKQIGLDKSIEIPLGKTGSP